MLTNEDNEILCRVGPGTMMGNLLRRYWTPALLSSEVPTPDSPPVRCRLMGEDLVAFRDTDGKLVYWTTTAHIAGQSCSSVGTRNADSAASTTDGSSMWTARV